MDDGTIVRLIFLSGSHKLMELKTLESSILSFCKASQTFYRLRGFFRRIKEEAMFVRDVSKEDDATMREIIRSVDKKLDYNFRDGNDASGPGFVLHLTRESWEGTLTLGINDLRAAKTDLVSRNNIRQKIKSLRDHMWDSRLTKDVLGTKAANMLKEAGQGEINFRRPFMRPSTKR